MTSLLKVDLIIHGTADQYGRFSSAYPLFSLFSFHRNPFHSLRKDIKDSLIQNETRLSDESHVHV